MGLLQRFGRALGLHQPVRQRVPGARRPGPLDRKPTWGAGVLYFHHPIDGASAPVVVSPGSYANCISYCTSAPGTITLNSGNVSAWADQTGNSRGYTQASALRQPLYVASGGVNGLPYIKFAGSTTNELRWVPNGFSGVFSLTWMVLRPQWPGSGPGTSLWYYLGDGNSLQAALTTVASSVGSSTTTVTCTNTGASAGESPATLNEGQGYVVDCACDTGNQNNGGQVNASTNYGDSSNDATLYVCSTPFNLGDCQTLTLCANFELYEIAIYNSFTNLSTIRSQNFAYAQSVYGAGI